MEVPLYTVERGEWPSGFYSLRQMTDVKVNERRCSDGV